MEFRYFTHSWLSDWNHGNAHFLRGLANALLSRGHSIRIYEDMPATAGGWSLSHLLQEPGGRESVAQVRRVFANVPVRFYGAGAAGPDRVSSWPRELQGAEFVIVHEWNPPQLLDWLVAQRARYGFRLLLHDTHHRALSQPECLRRFPLQALDGVLAFGESLRRLYESWGVRRSFTLHEAADVERFAPPAASPPSTTPTVLWIGNWGDDERTEELNQFIFTPVQAVGVAARLHGVRYPAAARARLAALGIEYAGYLPNLEAPQAYARAQLSFHVPRRLYAARLPGIPTIRVFEALACGCPLLSAPWSDSEGLLEPGRDFWPARDGKEMSSLLMQLLTQEGQRKQLGLHGAATIRARHTCAHRALQLEAICRELG